MVAVDGSVVVVVSAAIAVVVVVVVAVVVVIFAAECRIRTWDVILRPKAALEHGMSFHVEVLLSLFLSGLRPQ